MFASHLASPADQLERDLACAELWGRSLERSRRRREVAALHRKHAPRRKGVSLAMSAALLASPMVPMASAAGGGTGSTPTEEPGSADAEGVLAGDAILRQGDTGAAVAAAQRKLAVDDDGIFGPITEGAVADFQGRTGLPVTGQIDARTWTELFRAAVTFAPEGSPAAQAVQSSTSAKPAAEPASVAAPASVAEPADDEGDSAPTARAASNDEAPAASGQSSDSSSRRTAPSGGDDSSERDARSQRESGDREGRSQREPEEREGRSQRDLDQREGGARPEAGVNRESDVERGVDASDVLKPVVARGGDCATGKLATPTQGVRTSGFGDGRNHAGIDIGAPMGTAVRAALCGTVTQAGVQGAYGNIVCIRHTASFSTCYAHLSSINTRAGAYVQIGQLIGRVGSTGRSTGPHLHFETRVNGRGEDPDQYMKGGKRVPGGGSQARAASSSDAQRSSSRSSTRASEGSGSTQPSSSSTQYASSDGDDGAASSGTSSQPEQQPAPAEQQAAPAEQQAAPAEQQAAPAEQQQEYSSETTITTQASEPQPAPAADAPVEDQAEAAAPVQETPAPVEEPAAEPVVEATEPVAEPVVEAPAVEAAPEAAPAVETPAPAAGAAG